MTHDFSLNRRALLKTAAAAPFINRLGAAGRKVTVSTDRNAVAVVERVQRAA